MQYASGVARAPSPAIANGITSQKVVVNYDLACQQHLNYIATLKQLGIAIDVLPANADYPDSHFVEDTAIIYQRQAIMTQPGAQERRGEVSAIQPSLQKYLPTQVINAANAYIDGGDVLQFANKVLIGISYRTNLAGANALANYMQARNSQLEVYFIAFSGVLHLKSGIVALNDETLLISPKIIIDSPLPSVKKIFVPTAEAYAANSLIANQHALVFAECQQTQHLLAQQGLTPIPLDMSEFKKMDGSFTCLSLLW